MIKIWRPLIHLPTVLHNDYNILAAKLALEEQLALLSKAAREALHLPRLDQLPEEVVDLLANQYHADFYEADFDIATKRELVRDALRWHRIKGTPAVVEEVAKKVFKDAHVTEWYEYGGRPYYFRIMQDISSGDEDADPDTMNKLRAAVKESKNTRSWLEFYGFLLTLEDPIESDDAIKVELNHIFRDEYDFGRNNDRHDGKVDYGAFPWRYNGTLSYGGANTYKGYVSRGDYGRWQAPNFEQLKFLFEMKHSDAVESTDAFKQRIRLKKIRDRIDISERSLFSYVLRHVDNINTVDTIKADVLLRASDRVTASDRPPAFNLNHRAFELVDITDRASFSYELNHQDTVGTGERTSFYIELNPVDAVETREIITNELNFKPTPDTVSTADRITQHIEHTAGDAQEARDGVQGIDMTNYTAEELATRDGVSGRITRAMTYGGIHSFNGKTTYSGNIITNL